MRSVLRGLGIVLLRLPAGEPEQTMADPERGRKCQPGNPITISRRWCHNYAGLYNMVIEFQVVVTILLPFQALVKDLKCSLPLQKADRLVSLIPLWLTRIIPLGPSSTPGFHCLQLRWRFFLPP